MENLIINNNETLFMTNIIYHAKLHWTSYVFPTIYTVIGGMGILPLFMFRGIPQVLALILVFLFFKGIFRILKNRTIKIYVTEGFLTISSGIFSKSIVDISLAKMEGMMMQQTFLGKILNYGVLIVSTGATTCSYNIKSPMELRRIVINTRK
ncbi:PH domain-containing protein [Epilithonimonas caeni]|uniref:PH domain-containing protein n=1 Tax=Epilithonimonas caeni TaxID=365343 RepID=UPI0004858256|nr:PH domain-containing protein [Epilithonimonas caeni]